MLITRAPALRAPGIDFSFRARRISPRREVSTPWMTAIEAAKAALRDASCDRHLTVVDTRPTTLAGVVAKLDFIVPLHAAGDFNEDDSSSLEYLRNDLAYLAGL